MKITRRSLFGAVAAAFAPRPSGAIVPTVQPKKRWTRMGNGDLDCRAYAAAVARLCEHGIVTRDEARHGLD